VLAAGLALAPDLAASEELTHDPGSENGLYPAPDLDAAKRWYVVDPFGNRFGLIENPHFNVDAVR